MPRHLAVLPDLRLPRPTLSLVPLYKYRRGAVRKLGRLVGLKKTRRAGGGIVEPWMAMMMNATQCVHLISAVLDKALISVPAHAMRSVFESQLTVYPSSLAQGK